MRSIKKKINPGPAPVFMRAPVPEPPKLPEVERTFFGILLEALGEGLQEEEKELRKLSGHSKALCANSRLRGTAAYARALLRLEEYKRADFQGSTEQTELSALLNVAVNNLRRSFLYAGTAVRRPESEPLFPVSAPKDLVLFLLEEMLACCLRCAPKGRNLYINARPIGPALLLSMRTEGPVLQQSPLIPVLSHPNEPAQSSPPSGEPAPEEDYGFAVCRVLAAQLGWALRWEADEAGVRMFLDIV